MPTRDNPASIPTASFGPVRAIAWLALVVSTASLLAFDVRPSDLPGGVAGPVPVVYREVNGRQAKLDLYLPAGPPPRGGWPIALAIHGGGWRGGSKDEFGLMVARLARHGYLVASADYRLSRPGSPSWPENFEDVREAVRWLRRNARRYDADPSRIVAIGASAGGHLAALLGTYPDGPVSGQSRLEGDFAPSDGSARVQAVVNFYGPTDLAELARIKPATVGSLALFLGGPAATFPGRYRDASPGAHASPDDPPMLLIYGSADPLIPTSQADRLAESLDSAGVPRRLIVVEGAVHGFGFRAGTRDLLPELLAFLDEVWARRVGPGGRGDRLLRAGRPGRSHPPQPVGGEGRPAAGGTLVPAILAFLGQAWEDV